MTNMTPALSTNTDRAYRADVSAWEYWLNQRGYRIPPEGPVPLQLLADFMTACALGDDVPPAKYSTIRRRVAAIARQYAFQETDAPMAHPDIKTVLDSIKQAQRYQPSQKSGLLRSDYQALIGTCGDRMHDVRDKALLAIGYAIGVSLDELTGMDVDRIAITGQRVHVVRGDGEQVPLNQKDSFYVLSYLRQSRITEGALFRSFGGPGTNQRIKPQAVTRMMKKRAKLAGLDATRYSGHSLSRCQLDE